MKKQIEEEALRVIFEIGTDNIKMEGSLVNWGVMSHRGSEYIFDISYYDGELTVEVGVLGDWQITLSVDKIENSALRNIINSLVP